MAYLRIKAQKWEKNFWCRLFGHIVDGYSGGVPYGSESRFKPVDNLGTEHVHLHVKCDRCKQRVVAVAYHR